MQTNVHTPMLVNNWQIRQEDSRMELFDYFETAAVNVNTAVMYVRSARETVIHTSLCRRNKNFEYAKSEES